jgi:hypothetical protein
VLHLVDGLMDWGTYAGVEERTTGALSWGVVSLYIMAAGGMLWLTLVVLLNIGEQSGQIMSDAWVGWWSVNRCASPRPRDSVQEFLIVMVQILVIQCQ